MARVRGISQIRVMISARVVRGKTVTSNISVRSKVRSRFRGSPRFSVTVRIMGNQSQGFDGGCLTDGGAKSPGRAIEHLIFIRCGGAPHAAECLGK